MNQELQIFDNPEFGKIRALTIDDEPWFVGKDVAVALGYSDTSDALKRHVDKEDKLTRRFTDSGQSRDMYIINESGVYSLIFGSHLENARRFKRWVTSVVLPSIRRTGGYQMDEPPRAAQRSLTPDDYLRAASIMSTCWNERLPYVRDLLEQGGFSIPKVEKPRKPSPYDRELLGTIWDTLQNAINVRGFSLDKLSEIMKTPTSDLYMYYIGKEEPDFEKEARMIRMYEDYLKEKQRELEAWRREKGFF